MSIDQILPTTIIINHGGIDNIEVNHIKMLIDPYKNLRYCSMFMCICQCM
jgi:hypothetical protein